MNESDSKPGSEPIVTAGIDVGSSGVKIALVASGKGGGRPRPDARVLGRYAERFRRRDHRAVVDSAYELALDASGVAPQRIDYVATTGDGELVGFRTGHFYSVTAHARGALFLDPGARAVVDLGALHARVIQMDSRSKVLGYRMTSQCASGTGQFLENISRYLGVTLDQIGPLSLEADRPEQVSGICSVLAETDVINMISRGISTANILKGIHQSMADRVVKLLRSIRAEGPVLVTGGLSADAGLLRCLAEAAAEARLCVEVRTHPEAAYAGALGAALWGAYRHERFQRVPAGQAA
jgi:benzoyl-CoA reductase subunit D